MEQLSPLEKREAKRQAKAKQREERKEKKLAARRERQHRAEKQANEHLNSGPNYGDVQVKSQTPINSNTWTSIQDLSPALTGQSARVRGHLQTCRALGKVVFVVIRSTMYSIQGVAAVGGVVTREMMLYIANVPLESVVDIEGIVTAVSKPVAGVSQDMVEVRILQFFCVSRAKAKLPFSIHTDNDLSSAWSRRNHRCLDLRNPTNQAIFRIQSMAGILFREYLGAQGFVEVHSPRLVSSDYHGDGHFSVDYFGQTAILANSQTRHLQMAAACSGFGRVYECGPVFEAQNYLGRAHLSEYTRFEFEMSIHEHYNEVLGTLEDLLLYIIDGIHERCKTEMKRVKEQHPFQDIQLLRPTLKLTFAQGLDWLRDAGHVEYSPDSLSTRGEQRLGELVKEKYGTDIFILDKCPLTSQPFYTTPCPESTNLSNSAVFFVRGQRIGSCAQHIHDAQLLAERAKPCAGVKLAAAASDVEPFRHGAMPHGGGGFDLERFVMQFLNLSNVRKASLFPRDPRRLTP